MHRGFHAWVGLYAKMCKAKLAVALLARVINRMHMRRSLRWWFVREGGVQTRVAEMMRSRRTRLRDHTRQTR